MSLYIIKNVELKTHKLWKKEHVLMTKSRP